MPIGFLTDHQAGRHGPRIGERHGTRAFTDFGVAFRLNRFLYALCWMGTDRPSALFDRATASSSVCAMCAPSASTAPAPAR